MGQVVHQADLVHWMKLCPRKWVKFPGSRREERLRGNELMISIERARLGAPGTLWM
jgi:hypothetical protein